MDLFDVLRAMVVLLAFYCLGWVIVFISRVKLGLKEPLFKCQMCGTCCRLRLISITNEDAERIKAAGHSNFTEKVKNENMMKRDKGRCVFLKDDKCSIHEIRPQICRDFPFFKKFGLTYCRAVSYCPAIEELKNA